MDKGISKPVGAQELEPVSLSALIHRYVRIAIETAVHEELRAALGTSPYERSDVRRGYRNGVRSGRSRDRPAQSRSRCLARPSSAVLAT
jgi:transposase-like protein